MLRSGDRIGRLVLLKAVSRRNRRGVSNYYREWLCRCDCGLEEIVGGIALSRWKHSGSSSACSQCLPAIRAEAAREAHPKAVRDPEERRAAKIARQRAYYQRLMSTPEGRAARRKYNQEFRAKKRDDPVYAMAMREKLAESKRVKALQELSRLGTELQSRKEQR